MDELDDVIAVAKDTSKLIVETLGEEHSIIILALTPEGLMIIKPLMVSKEIFKPALIEILRSINAHAYVLTCEAWIAKISLDSPVVGKINSGELHVRDLPPDDKQEAIIVVAAENGKSFRGWSANVEYACDSSRYLGEWKGEQGFAAGRMIVKEW